MIGKDNRRGAKGAEMSKEALNLIGEGTQITGDINSSGDVRIDGAIKGNISTKARLVLGPNGKISGDVQAQNADVQGKVEGKVVVSEVLFLKSTALINGDIITNKLVVESGAEFNGNCVMKSGNSIMSEASSNGIRKGQAEKAGV